MDVIPLSYALLPAHRRKGLMKEGLARVLDYLFTLKACILEARVHPGNDVSVSLLLSLGFQQTTIRDNRLIYTLEK